uniref:Uncharacterized protein n=1 Tax=Candidatus Kentrum sp. TC TaxID=2126339 RepID=A0A450Z470_9GAMM|nr:MAG: hypothetical protein BECKTC1821D_GA0114238_106210 [Candidatus Kentron sp. TC]
MVTMPSSPLHASEVSSRTDKPFVLVTRAPFPNADDSEPALEEKQRNLDARALGLPFGGVFPIRLLFSEVERRKGPSGIRDADFSGGMGMFMHRKNGSPGKIFL